MTIRFRMTTESEQPEYPFQAGQIITVPRLTRDMKRWLREGRIELVPDVLERAVDIPDRRVVTHG